MNEARDLLEARHPGLLATIEAALVAAETLYNAASGQPPSEFLLEHTRRTTAIAHMISAKEGVDALLPVLVAMFHDAGKFHGGEYHQDGVPEEEHAAILAAQMLADFGLARPDIDAVATALRSLYDERLPCIGPARIVQDADRLDKLGAMGVGAFFTKAALRGRGMIDGLVQAASRELTYALAAPRSMFTASGRQLAAEQGAISVSFFDQLLAQLEAWGIAGFERRTVVLDEEFRSRDGALVRGMEVTIVMPRTCPDCGGPLALTHSREQGVKCERFIARFRCANCSYTGGTSLCLPVIA